MNCTCFQAWWSVIPPPPCPVHSPPACGHCHCHPPVIYTTTTTSRIEFKS